MSTRHVPQLAELLTHCRLTQYQAIFEAEGWDDVLYLLSLAPAELSDICTSCQMKRGHVMRFLDLADEFRRLHFVARAAPAAPAAPAASFARAHSVVAAPLDASVEVSANAPSVARGGGSTTALPMPPSPANALATTTAPAASAAASSASAAAGPNNVSADAPPAEAPPHWWIEGLHDIKMAEVLFLCDSKRQPEPHLYNDRLAFGSLVCKERFPGIEPQRLLQAAGYIDSQLVPGGRIRSHWQMLKSKQARIASVPGAPRPKRKPDLANNSKVWVDQVSKKPFYTDADGRIL